MFFLFFFYIRAHDRFGKKSRRLVTANHAPRQHTNTVHVRFTHAHRQYCVRLPMDTTVLEKKKKQSAVKNVRGISVRLYGLLLPEKSLRFLFVCSFHSKGVTLIYRHYVRWLYGSLLEIVNETRAL